MERLSKILARAGIASRRKAEALILAQKVKVNHKVVTNVGFKVTEKDVISVDDQVIEKEPLFYYIANKPKGYLSLVSKDEKRKNMYHLLGEENQDKRLFSIHQLPQNATGLLFITNDGVLTEKLTQKNSGLRQEFLLKIDGIVIKRVLQSFKKGLKINDWEMSASVARIEKIDKVKKTCLIRLVVKDVSVADLKLVFEHFGYKIKNLRRIRYDYLTISDLPLGTYRPLKIHEIRKIYRNDMSS